MGKFKHQIWIPLLFFVTAFLILWPFLIGKEVIVEKFVPVNQYPIFAFLSQSFKQQSTTPLWLPDYMSGYPFFVSAFSFLPPLSWLLKFLSFITVYNILLFLSFFLGSWLAYLFSKNIGLSKPAAVVSACIYAFSQLSMWWGMTLPFGFILPILPLMFLSVLEISKGRSHFLWVGSLGIAFGWFYGFSEYVAYSSAAVLLFALFLDISGWQKEEEVPRGKLKIFGLTVLMLALGGVLALPRLLPTFAFIGVSARSVAVPESSSFLGLGDILVGVYPYLKIPFTDLLPALTDHWFYLHFGIPAFILLTLFFLNAKGTLLKNKIPIFFVALFTLSFLMLFRFTHLSRIFQTLTFHLFRGAWKLEFLGGFSLAILAGFGLDSLEEVGVKKPFAIFLKILKYLFFVAASAVFILNLSILLFKDKILSILNDYFIRNFYARTASGQPLEYYFSLVHKVFDRIVGGFLITNYHFLVYIIFAFLFFLALYFYWKGRIRKEFFNRAAVAIVLLNFIFFWQGFFQSQPASAINNPPKVSEFFKNERPYSYRIFRFWPGSSAYYKMGLERLNADADFEIQKEMLTPDMNLIYGISSIEGDENFMSYRYSKILARVGSFKAPQNQGERWLYSDIPLAEKLARIQSQPNRNLLSMMGVKYVLTSFRFNPPWKKVFETKITAADIPVYIYENPDVLPRVYFAGKAKFVEPKEGIAYQELLEAKDFRRETIVECDKPECLYAVAKSNPSDKIITREIKPGYLSLKTSTKNPRWLVFSESHLPTWEARINGDLTPIYTANYLYQAIFVPPGENNITFGYPGVWGQIKYSGAGLFNKAFGFITNK